MSMCGMLSVSRLGYYDWRSRRQSLTAQRRRALIAQIRKVFDQSRRTYGCRRVTAALRRRGVQVSVGLVALLRRQAGLHAC